MNLHLHLHLKECIYDFEPSHSVWCFPFERFNEILGSYPTNNKAVEVQFMKKFLMTQSIQYLSNELNEHNLPDYLLPSQTQHDFLTVTDEIMNDALILRILNLPICPVESLCQFMESNFNIVKCLPPY